ncbi:CIA30 family protein [Muriicola marianensis]|uniref:NADH:ubiquinone oxidoreductase n=1 Tax=Muriicola marianensis TaxID=1324801 RepID=A0ABQ1QT28_9FLAO|nr:CIA30 family protein [Muriicola marianensis]GGD42365.1 NADH:ubiquinone oxidoreductase [Muriicola marianensis]
MPVLKFLLFLLMSQAPFTLFQFSDQADLSAWRIVNDGVMGGLSKGKLTLSEQGHGVFTGFVSLENNGGFTMIQHAFRPVEATHFTSLEIRLKGDGKKYQVRLKSSPTQYYNYSHTVSTTGEWQSIKIPFSEFRPQFRGRQLSKAPYPGQELGEVAILIGNKKAESFRLEIDEITLK